MSPISDDFKTRLRKCRHSLLNQGDFKSDHMCRACSCRNECYHTCKRIWFFRDMLDNIKLLPGDEFEWRFGFDIEECFIKIVRDRVI